MKKRKDFFGYWLLKPDGIKAISGVLGSLCFVITVFFMFIAVLALFTQEIHLTTPEKMYDSAALLFGRETIGSANCSVAKIFITSAHGIDFITWLGIAAIILTTALPLIFFTFSLGKILNGVRNDEIFTQKNANRMLGMGMSLFIINLVLPPFYHLCIKNLVNALSPNTMALSTQISWTTVLFALLLMILAYIFRYGVYLQNEYDHTL